MKVKGLEFSLSAPDNVSELHLLSPVSQKRKEYIK